MKHLMKQRKRIVWMIACLLICTMALFGIAGCGSSSEDPAAADPTAETTEEAAAETAGETAETAEESAEAEMISEQEALEMAFDASGFYIDDADDIDIHLSTEDGYTEYDITFRMEGMPYQYYVDAYTGDVYED